MFTFKKLRDRLFELRFDDQYEMCMTFLRYQEHYESPRFAGRKFTLAQYMSWYVKDQSKDGSFSYPQDWGGFNLPVDVIKRVRDLGIDDPNHYDDLMHYVYTTISAQCDGAYLIGVTGDGDLDGHEMTHAMFTIDDNYRATVLSTLDEWPALVDDLKRIILDNGYAEVTVLDEINAYITTGDHGFFEDLKDDVAYQSLKIELDSLRNKHYPDFIKDISS